MFKVKILSILAFVALAVNLYAQDVETTNSTSESSYNALHQQYMEQTDTAHKIIAPKRDKHTQTRQQRRDSIRAHKNLWLSVIGGPSFTPEASLGIGGALLANFKIDKSDSIAYRSFLPVGFNISINGTFVFAGAGTLFFNQNKFRIYSEYSYRNEPAHYYGKGYESIESNHRSDTTTLYNREYIKFYPRFVWMVKPNFYLGTLLDINYTKTSDVNVVMQNDPYYSSFRPKYTNIGVGAIIQYDTRDDVATPMHGMFASATGKIFSRALGGSYNFQMLDLEYRQFQPLFNRTILAFSARSTIGFNDVPFSELPTFGSPFDLRGYYWGQYRDKSMAYTIAEYRQMFGSQEDYDAGKLYSRLGYVLWAGAATIGETPKEWNRWKLNYGVGLRIQIQPRKNLRLDLGKAHGQKGMLFYLNMTEAF